MLKQPTANISEFQDAQADLSKRKFEKSLTNALQALDIARQKDAVNEQIEVLLLIIDITNTQGRYQNNDTLYQNSLIYLNDAFSILQLYPNEHLYWDCLLKKGITQLLLGLHAVAEETLVLCMADDKVLQHSSKKRIQISLAFSELHYLLNEYEEAANYVDIALDTLEGEDNDALLLEIYAQAVRVYLRKHEYGKTLEYGTKTLELGQKYGDVEREFIGLNAIAVYHGTKYDFKMAMLHFRNALDKSTEINYRYGTAFCLINIGTIYANLFNYHEALSRYMTVLDEYEDVLDDSTGLIIMNNVGNIYFTVGKLDEALEYFQRSMVLSETIHYTEMIAHALAQISRTLVAQKRYQEALDYAFRSEELLDESGAAEGKQINFITLGNIYYKLGDHNLAIKYVGKGIVSSKQIKDQVSEIRGYRLMSNIFRERGNFEKALDYQLIYSQAQEEYAMDQRNRQIIDIEIRYDLQQKEKEFELLKKYKDKLASQHEKITEQNEKLIDANNDLMQFAYAVSHDLKEPLRMIGSYSQLIQRRYASQLEASSGEFFDYVNEGVGRMSKLLDDLLKYATIGRGEALDFDVVDLSEILEITQFNLKLVIEESGAEVTANELPVIYSNRSFMSQLFQNLISNAIKFRVEGTTPKIHVHYEYRNQQHHLSFKDNGIGIPADALGRIFIVFQRLHKRGNYKGTGIGLSICMKIIEKLGGSIAVESEQGIGSTFIVTLPEKPGKDYINTTDTSLFLDEGL